MYKLLILGTIVGVSVGIVKFIKGKKSQTEINSQSQQSEQPSMA